MRLLAAAVRCVLRHRGAYASSAGILALGIGMSVAMFSLVDAVLLRPLPFPEQRDIQVIWKVDPAAGTHVEELAYPELGDLQQNINEFEFVALLPTSLYGYGKVLRNGRAERVQIESSPVSHDFFRVLGVAPVIGRDFAASDERVNAAPVVILSDRVWREQFSANPAIVGRLIQLNGEGYTAIGVMARGVEFPRGAGMWVPLGVEPEITEHRGATFLQAIARIRRGQAHNGIAGKVNALFKRLAADYPEAYSPSQQGVVTPLVEYWTGSARLHLWIMLGASLLLLIASTISAGNLLLSRTLARRSEIATRLALGAGPRQILAQLGAEGLVVATIAAAGGLAIAQAAIRFLVRGAPADIPRLPDAALNLNSFWFAAGAAAFAALACSIIPGWSATRMQVESALRESGGRSSISRRSARTQSLFILGQAAVTVMLLALAALLSLSYGHMLSADIGFANRDALSMNLKLRGEASDANSRRAFYTNLLDRLRESPGVSSAAAILVRPLEGPIGWDVTYQFEFEEGKNGNRVLPKGNYEVVTPEYFQTVGTPLLEGRDFSAHDTEQGENVVIISRTLAQRIRAAGYQALGYRVKLGLGGWAKVVGVCSDARYRSVTRAGVDLFVPYLQAAPPTNYLVIRGTLPPPALSALVRRTLDKIDPSQAVAGIATIGQLIDENTARHRFNMILLLWFGVCAVILAATGVYSVVAETMAARERDIAIKTALGAQRPRLVREMVSGTLGFVLMGEALGILATVALGSLASELLYGVSFRDPRILAAVCAFLLGISSTAAFWPAWIGAGGDPKRSLRV